MAFHESLKLEDFPPAFIGWLHKCLKDGLVTVKVTAGNGRGKQEKLLLDFFTPLGREVPADFGSESTARGLMVSTRIQTPHYPEQFPDKLHFTQQGQFVLVPSKILGMYALKHGAKLEYPRDNSKTLQLAGQSSFF